VVENLAGGFAHGEELGVGAGVHGHRRNYRRCTATKLLRLRSLASLVKTRGFGMTPILQIRAMRKRFS
jgi:hypothetical protein